MWRLPRASSGPILAAAREGAVHQLLAAHDDDATARAPRDWYELLNSRVFFWLTRARLNTLLGAKAYRHKVHTVLTIDSRPLIKAYEDAIELSPINSGCTKPFPHPRGRRTFQPITTYPFSERRATRGLAAVVELTIPRGVRDIKKYVIRAEHVRGDTVLDVMFEK